ncbi:hypothetical protein K490DRAFT_17278, partial [Saccharata proteae CBS 121410]
ASIARAEKDADDPTTPLEPRRSSDRSDRNTLHTLTRLFAVTSPDNSRMPSYTQPSSTSPSFMHPTSLPQHIFDRGLRSGRHSDITVVAFGEKYRLHRLILDQAPFFANALSGPWLESRAEEITLHPEEVDPCITKLAFELTLKRLYGSDISEDEDAHCLGLFATACWLEMQDLLESSIDAILRRMHPDNLGTLIKLFTVQYYGLSGGRLLSSAKAMLCRDGFEMKLKNWDDIPGEIVREIVGGDGFYVPGEGERWLLAKRLLDRRLRRISVEVGLVEKGKRANLKAPDTLGLMAVRFDSVYRQNAITTGMATRPGQKSGDQQRWIALYTHHEIEPLLVLLEEGIHYVHMDFEQLQLIRKARDMFGLPIVSEKVITNALWMQLELRQKVMSAGTDDLELGLSQPAQPEQYSLAPTSTAKTDFANDKPTASKGKEPATEPATAVEQETTEEMDSGSWDANGKPRKFLIPSIDCNIVMGGAADPVVTTSNTPPRHASNRLSATLQPEDVQWMADFSISPDANRTPTPFRPGSSGKEAGPSSKPKTISYTHFPPFRFAVEFPNPRGLREKIRVYSRTVFYAGSLWNIYIQKVRSAKQLGVYLHRAKDYSRDPDASAGIQAQSVEAKIERMEREFARTERRRNDRSSRRAEQASAVLAAAATEEETSGSGGDPDTIVGEDSPLRPSPLSRLNHLQLGVDSEVSGAQRPDWMRSSSGFSSDSSDDGDDDLPTGSRRQSVHHLSSSTLVKHHDSTKQQQRPTLPPYSDTRPTIKTYFKIYSPSKGGRLLSVYESAPDEFNFSQSWGWKSSTLMLDDAAAGTGEPAAHIDGKWREKGSTKKGDGLLRFMVVIGNL